MKTNYESLGKAVESWFEVEGAWWEVCAVCEYFERQEDESEAREKEIIPEAENSFYSTLYYLEKAHNEIQLLLAQATGRLKCELKEVIKTDDRFVQYRGMDTDDVISSRIMAEAIIQKEGILYADTLGDLAERYLYVILYALENLRDMGEEEP